MAFNAGSTFLVDARPRRGGGQGGGLLDITIANGTQLRGSVIGPLAAVSYPLLTTTQGSTVGTTGFQDVTGVNLPPPSGGPITVDAAGRSTTPTPPAPAKTSP
ncbi:MAG: hypothetical protein U0797_21470 [Gemmataceae bacterium]